MRRARNNRIEFSRKVYVLNHLKRYRPVFLILFLAPFVSAGENRSDRRQDLYTIKALRTGVKVTQRSKMSEICFFKPATVMSLLFKRVIFAQDSAWTQECCILMPENARRKVILIKVQWRDIIYVIYS